MKHLEQELICTEIVETSTSLEEISDRINIVQEVLNIPPQSKYYYISDKNVYYVDTQPIHCFTKCPPGYIELSRDEYYQGTLPEWGSDLIKILCD